MFRTLDLTFPNISEVEIWTPQDIPNNHKVTDEYHCGLFYLSYGEWDDDG
jgi:hypothetical protein